MHLLFPHFSTIVNKYIINNNLLGQIYTANTLGPKCDLCQFCSKKAVYTASTLRLICISFTYYAHHTAKTLHIHCKDTSVYTAYTLQVHCRYTSKSGVYLQCTLRSALAVYTASTLQEHCKNTGILQGHHKGHRQ